jgi:hypothetical protein
MTIVTLASKCPSAVGELAERVRKLRRQDGISAVSGWSSIAGDTGFTHRGVGTWFR